MADKVKIENIFTEEDIECISMSSNPILIVYETYHNYLLKTSNRTLLDSNMIMAISEFHVANLLFLKENFTFPLAINCKLLNIFGILLKLREEVKTSPWSQANLVRSGTYDDINPNIVEKEIDFSAICNQKVNQIKKAFIESNLIKVEMKYDREQENKYQEDTSYYLKPIEISIIMDYLNVFYFSNIRLYYHFINIEKITNNKHIDVVINKPLPVPPLQHALLQPPDKNEISFIEEEEDSVVILII